MSDSPLASQQPTEGGVVPSADEPDAGLFRRKAKSDAAGGNPQPQQQAAAAACRSLADPEVAYAMNHARRGHCYIFNQVQFAPETRQSERVGSDVDADCLERTFRKLQFDVTVFRNLTCALLGQAVHELAQRDHAECDCAVLAILSHGENGYVYGFDGKLQLEKLTRLLRADRCLSLAGKPKLIFIQACRGSEFDKGHAVHETTDGGDDRSMGKVSRIPLESDFLFFYSTPPGYYSWRNDQDGSWFVQQLCRVLSEQAGRTELGHLLVTVQRLVASEYQSRTGEAGSSGMKQIPVTVSTLRKLLYLRRK